MDEIGRRENKQKMTGLLFKSYLMRVFSWEPNEKKVIFRFYIKMDRGDENDNFSKFRLEGYFFGLKLRFFIEVGRRGKK